jgi:hypothetical protein
VVALVVNAIMQWDNCGGEQHAGGQFLSNHRWWTVLVALTHEEGLEHHRYFDVLGREVFLAGDRGSLGLLG